METRVPVNQRGTWNLEICLEWLQNQQSNNHDAKQVIAVHSPDLDASLYLRPLMRA